MPSPASNVGELLVSNDGSYKLCPTLFARVCNKGPLAISQVSRPRRSAKATVRAFSQAYLARSCTFAELAGASQLLAQRAGCRRALTLDLCSPAGEGLSLDRNAERERQNPVTHLAEAGDPKQDGIPRFSYAQPDLCQCQTRVTHRVLQPSQEMGLRRWIVREFSAASNWLGDILEPIEQSVANLTRRTSSSARCHQLLPEGRSGSATEARSLCLSPTCCKMFCLFPSFTPTHAKI